MGKTFSCGELVVRTVLGFVQGVFRVEHVYTRGARAGTARIRRSVHRLVDPSCWAPRCEHAPLEELRPWSFRPWSSNQPAAAAGQLELGVAK